MAATKKDSYETKSTRLSTIYDAQWSCQTFTTTSAYSISSVKFALNRFGTKAGSVLYCNLYAVDGNGKPTGASLASGNMNGSDVTDASTPTVYEITFGTATNLTNATKYALVLNIATDGIDGRIGNWGLNSDGYAGGQWLQSTDSGSNWTGFDYDMYFETWGDDVVEPAEEKTHTISSFLYKKETATHTIDTSLKARPTTQHSIDSLLSAENIVTHTIDSTLTKINLKAEQDGAKIKLTWKYNQ